MFFNEPPECVTTHSSPFLIWLLKTLLTNQDAKNNGAELLGGYKSKLSLPLFLHNPFQSQINEKTLQAERTGRKPSQPLQMGLSLF